MGERLLRPGIRTSDRTAALVRAGGWMAQVFYDWLITVVDDYGRYDGRPSILRVEVFPLLLEMVREADVQRCLAACEKAGLVRLYKVDGRPYVELLDFRQRLRAAKSRWPAPPDNAGVCHDNDMTMPTDTDTETHTETETPRARPRGADGMPIIPKALDSPEFKVAWANWLEHLRQKRKKPTPLAAERQLAKCETWGARAVEFINHAIEHNWQGLYEPKEGNGAPRPQRAPVIPGNRTVRT